MDYVIKLIIKYIIYIFYYICIHHTHLRTVIVIVLIQSLMFLLTIFVSPL